MNAKYGRLTFIRCRKTVLVRGDLADLERMTGPETALFLAIFANPTGRPDEHSIPSTDLDLLPGSPEDLDEPGAMVVIPGTGEVSGLHALHPVARESYTIEGFTAVGVKRRGLPCTIDNDREIEESIKFMEQSPDVERVRCVFHGLHGDMVVYDSAKGISA